MTLEVITARPQPPDPALADRPSLLFVHGAFTGAWCWEEHFLPWFAARGWEARALSLRGHGGSSGTEALDRHSLADYVDDLAAVAGTLDHPPILIGHSMGGMVVQKYLEQAEAAAAVLMCSVPPTGLLTGAVAMSLRFPDIYLNLWRLNTMGPGAASAHSLEKALFALPLEPHVGMRYWSMMQAESARAVLDLTWLDVPRTPLRPDLPVLVMGSTDDPFVSANEAEFTATYHSGDFALMDSIGHAMMLDPAWEKAALRLDTWLREAAF